MQHTDEDLEEETFYGWYSSTAARRYGTTIYKDVDGKEVVITAVTKKKENPYKGGIYEHETVCVGSKLTYSGPGMKGEKKWRII